MAENINQNVSAKRVYTRLEFTREEEEQIISFVKLHPELYNLKHSDYKNKIKKDQLWNDLGITMNKKG